MAAAAPGQLNLDESPSFGSRSVDCFEKLEQIGEGTYGYASLETPPIPQSRETTPAHRPSWAPPTDSFFVLIAARQVFMAKEMETKEIVALKKIRMDNEREGVSIPPSLFHGSRSEIRTGSRLSPLLNSAPVPYHGHPRD